MSRGVVKISEFILEIWDPYIELVKWNLIFIKGADGYLTLHPFINLGSQNRPLPPSQIKPIFVPCFKNHSYGYSVSVSSLI